MIVNKKLSNGVTLVAEHFDESRTCSIGFWFFVGSRYEKKGEYGISHFTEHLLFKGTQTRSTHDIACAFDRIGGYVNAFTERDDVCMFCTIPAVKNNVEIALNTLCDMSCNCSFPEEEFNKEKKVVQSEIAAVADDPDEAATDAVAAFVWKNQCLGHSITGDADEVEKISREQVKEWYEKYFVHGKLTVFVSGKFEEDEIVSLLEKLPVHNQDKPFVQSLSDKPVWKSGNCFIKAPCHQNLIYVLYPFEVPVTAQEYYSLSIFNAITGDSMSSRLFDSLREKSGLCYNVYSFFTFYEDAGLWCAYSSCENKYSPEVIRKIHEEFIKLVKDGVSEKEIEDARQHVCGEEIMGSEDMEYVIKRNERNYALGLPLLDTDEIINCCRTITKVEIIGIIEKIFNKAERALVVWGPKINSRQKKEFLWK